MLRCWVVDCFVGRLLWCLGFWGECLLGGSIWFRLVVVLVDLICCGWVYCLFGIWYYEVVGFTLLVSLLGGGCGCGFVSGWLFFI